MSEYDSGSTSGESSIVTQEPENDEAASSDLSKLALNTPLSSDNLSAELPPSRHIRLLKLFPGAGQDATIMELTVYPLDNAPKFDVISYVWGDSKKAVPVQCNESAFNITMNLRAALIRVRYPDQPRIVWADAICINQRDIKKRDHHVGFMGMIYSQAETVLVCFVRMRGMGQKMSLSWKRTVFVSLSTKVLAKRHPFSRRMILYSAIQDGRRSGRCLTFHGSHVHGYFRKSALLRTRKSSTGVPISATEI